VTKLHGQLGTCHKTHVSTYPLKIPSLLKDAYNVATAVTVIILHIGCISAVYFTLVSSFLINLTVLPILPMCGQSVSAKRSFQSYSILKC